MPVRRMAAIGVGQRRKTRALGCWRHGPPDLALVPVHSVVPRLVAIRLLITGDRRADAPGCASRDAAGGKTISAF